MTPCTDCLYFNGWFDWDGDGLWSMAEHEIHALIADPPPMGAHALVHSGFQLFKVVSPAPGLVAGHGDRDADGTDNINDEDEIRIEQPLESRSPYLHWDLREFPCGRGTFRACRIPFSLNSSGTPDVPEKDLQAALDAALAGLSVAGVQPYRTAATTSASVAQDEINSISFKTRAELAALGVATSENTAGIACLFWHESGVIHEVDVALNEAMTFTTSGTKGGKIDLQAILMHEVGHGLGMAHCNVPYGALSPVDCRVMHTPLLGGTSQRVLGGSDRRALEYLYSWDLGDAPDPFTDFNAYPTRVRSIRDGRPLNGETLFAPKLGAVHMYPQVFRLGGASGLDDGVAISPLIPGTVATVTATVDTFDGPALVSRDYLYSVTVPPSIAPLFFSRFRLDLWEDSGQAASIQDVALETRLAQYGEVEDYGHASAGTTNHDIDARVDRDDQGGPDDVVVSWTMVPQIQRYNVYQSFQPDRGFEPLPPVPSCDLQQDAIRFPAQVSPGQVLFFLVGGIDDQNNETSLGLLTRASTLPPPWADLRDNHFQQYINTPCLPP